MLRGGQPGHGGLVKEIRSMRLLVGEFSHESNCFCAGPTRLADFEAHQFLLGDAVLEAHRGKRTVLGGFLDAAADGAHEVIPSVAASCLPSGPVEAALERKPGVLDLSVHGGFYGSDQPEAGFSVVCTTDGDRALAQRLAGQLAREAWRRREEFIVDLVPLERAVADALAAG